MEIKNAAIPINIDLILTNSEINDIKALDFIIWHVSLYSII